MTADYRLGEAVELPWWVIALSLVPASVVVAALVIPAAVGLRLLAIVPSVLLISMVVRVAIRVRSTNLQSVWISLAFGIWIIFPVAWGVGLATSGH